MNRLRTWLIAITFAVVASDAGAQAPQSLDLPVLMQADELSYDKDLGLVVAKGNVEIMQGERILLADAVSYNLKTDTVTATGNISLLDPEGDVVFADYVELSDELKNGVIENLRIRLSDDSRIAANFGRRTNGVRTTMNKVVYSPCKPCEDDPEAAPLWQVKAEKVVHDKEKREVVYNHARLEMWGVPVAYTPYLSHPDPTVRRKTGFLSPAFGSNGNVGVFVETPFFFAIDRDKDATLRPIYTKDEGIIYSGEYRQRFDNGEFNISGSLVEADRESGESGNLNNNEDEIRGHVFADGRLDIDETYRAGFDINRSTDRTYLRRFPFFGDSENVLTSRVFLEGFRRRNYLAINAYDYQDLRLGLRPDTKRILPNANFHGNTEADRFGGRWNIDGDFRSLYVDDAPQSQRASAKAGYRIPFVTPIGLLATVSANVRGDVYYVDYNDQRDNSTEARFVPDASVDLRYPVSRGFGDFVQVIEPVAGFVLKPNGLNDDDIPNDDSTVIEEDYTNLTSVDRAPGLDRVESGKRAYYGLNLGMYDPWGGNISAFIGQSYRFDDDDELEREADLNQKFSNFVGAVELAPLKYVDILYRFQLDEKTFDPNVNEVGFRVGPDALNVSGDYIYLKNEPTDDVTRDREEITTRLDSKIDETWRTSLYGQRDLNRERWIKTGVSVIYEDECFVFEGKYDRDYNSTADVDANNTFFFRLTFKTLGEVATGSI